MKKSASHEKKVRRKKEIDFTHDNIACDTKKWFSKTLVNIGLISQLAGAMQKETPGKQHSTVNELEQIHADISFYFFSGKEDVAEFRIARVKECMAVDERYGFTHPKESGEKIGYLVNMHSVSKFAE